MEKFQCAVCGKTGRYQMADGSWRCDKDVPDVSAPAQPTSCKVFSATRSYDREHLGERVTEWIRAGDIDVTTMFVVQSSDNAFHCISMVVFYRERT